MIHYIRHLIFGPSFAASNLQILNIAIRCGKSPFQIYTNLDQAFYESINFEKMIYFEVPLSS